MTAETLAPGVAAANGGADSGSREWRCAGRTNRASPVGPSSKGSTLRSHTSRVYFFGQDDNVLPVDNGPERVVKPADASEQEPIFKRETMREVGPHTLFYDQPVHGKVFDVELTSGPRVRVFRADDGEFYFCHGLTFGGKQAPGGAVSPFSGKDVRTILDNRYQVVVPESDAVRGDILVRNEESFPMTEATTIASLPAKSQDQPPLACRLRPKEVIGRQGPIPNMGEMELENRSDAPLQIEYTMTPLQFFELEVIGPAGGVVSEGHFSDRFSPMREVAVLRLMPGEKFTSNVPLLATVPHDKRSPGRYTVQASYRLQGRRVLAEPLAVELTGGA